MSHKSLGAVILLFISVCCAIGPARAAQPDPELPLTTQWTAYRLGEDGRAQSGLHAQAVAVLFVEPEPGWYTYSNSPGGLAKPTRLSARHDGSELAVLYPPGEPKEDLLTPGERVMAYVGKTPLFVPLPSWPARGGPRSLDARLELLLCAKDKCLPARLDLPFVLPDEPLGLAESQPWWPLLRAAAQDSGQDRAPAASSGEIVAAAGSGTTAAGTDQDWTGLRPRYFQPELEVAGLAKAVLLALLAGLILNFMPCVLPVISIKLSALLAGGVGAEEAQRRRGFREHSLFFALGILLYFLALSAVLGATGMAWGQLFQRADVVMLLAALIFLLSLSLFGVFSLPMVDLKFDQKTSHPRLQALLTGLLATLLATPCSGPFLGGVLGWTLMQPPWVISTVLAAIGLGMALPYLSMALFPALARLFPRPGPWTGHLEKGVGLFLAGTSIYLLAILPSSRLVSALVLLWFAAAAAMAWGAAGPGLDSRRSVALKSAAALLLALGMWIGLRPAAPPAQMEPFSAAGLQSRLGRETVLVDFTADWCPTCKVLERTTLTPERLGDMKKRFGLAMLKADLTAPHAEAESLLLALGSKSIPLLAIFPKDAPAEPLVLRDLFTPSQLEEALKSTASP